MVSLPIAPLTVFTVALIAFAHSSGKTLSFEFTFLITVYEFRVKRPKPNEVFN